MINYENIQIKENINLGGLTTMKIGGLAKYSVVVKNIEEIQAALRFAKSGKLPIFILGGGSNTIVRDEGFDGLVIKNELTGIKILDENNSTITFEIGSGENWDNFVRYAIGELNLSGCEAMAMIPGTVGALPVQNVGAYGQDTAQIFAGCSAIKLSNGESVDFLPEDCRLGYRSSIFREDKIGEFFITSVKLTLSKTPKKIPLYFSVAEYFRNRGISEKDITPKMIMEAVIFLRREKLPDPSDIPSAGSFFKNVELSSEQASKFKEKFPDGMIFEENGKYKIPTGWLIDNAGLRGKLIHGMKPHDKNALILTNISAKSYTDLDLARTEIRKAVKEKFGFVIEQEPLEI